MLWEFIIVKSRTASSIARMVECVAAQLPRLSRSLNNTQGMESLRTTALSKKKDHLLETFSVSQCPVSRLWVREVAGLVIGLLKCNFGFHSVRRTAGKLTPIPNPYAKHYWKSKLWLKENVDSKLKATLDTAAARSQ